MKDDGTSDEDHKRVADCNETELRKYLVEDAVKHHATDLMWAFGAYERIGKLSGRGAEWAINAVLDEVLALTGQRRLPLNPGATAAEIRGPK